MLFIVIIAVMGCSHTLPSLHSCEALYLKGDLIGSADCSLKVKDEKGLLLFGFILAERGYTETARNVVKGYRYNDRWRNYVEGFIEYKEGRYYSAYIKFRKAEALGLKVPDIYFYLILTGIKLCDKDTVNYYLRELRSDENFAELVDRINLYALRRMKGCGQ